MLCVIILSCLQSYANTRYRYAVWELYEANRHEWRLLLARFSHPSSRGTPVGRHVDSVREDMSKNNFNRTYRHAVVAGFHAGSKPGVAVVLG
jgi:hypothetical protein